MPLVYSVENTGSDSPKQSLLTIDQLPVIQNLPDPFVWSDGRGRISNFSDWRYRRAEIKAEIENYEIGKKPDRPDTITASYSGGKLTVKVTKNGQTLTLTSTITLPSGSGPFPAIIGMNSETGSLPSDIFSTRKIARISYMHDQVVTYNNKSKTDPYFKLYPDLFYSGEYAPWAWGVSRIIDGLELVKDVLPIDLKHLAVSGCSYAGKMALFAGAFDERIALTIAQESGGGGAAAWRYSETMGSVEKLGSTSHQWFMESMFKFSGSNVYKLPHDHHELMAMVAPRALFVLGNPDYTWLADESGYVSCKAAYEVWKALGVADRFGYSIVGGHMHCALPASQKPEVEAFVEKFLLGNDTTNTNIARSPYNTSLSPWITWTTPTLSNKTSFFGQTILVYPSDIQTGLNKEIIFRWNKLKDAAEYFVQLSTDASFTTIAKIDSTTDTVKTITNLLEGKKYYWRVRVKNGAGLSGPWSITRSFTTFINLPTTPQIISATPYPGRQGWITFKWKKAKDADQYYVQISFDQSFSFLYNSATTSDTSTTIIGFDEGQNYYWRVQAKNIAGSSPWSEASSILVDIKEEEIPIAYSLSQNYPNPFNPETTISYKLQAASNVSLKVYDLLGREVTTLVDEFKQLGNYTVKFDTRHVERSRNISSGIYFYTLNAGSFVQTKQMLVIK